MGRWPAANSDQMSCPKRAIAAVLCVHVICVCVCVHDCVGVFDCALVWHVCAHKHGSLEPSVYLNTRTHVCASMGLRTGLVTACVRTPVSQVGLHPAPSTLGACAGTRQP